MATFDRQWIISETGNPKMRLAGGESHAGLAEEAAVTEDLGTIQVGFERRAHRRFDVDALDVSIERWDGRRDSRAVFGRVVDMSAGGVRLRTRQPGVRTDQQIRVRLELPNNGGICPSIDTADGELRPKREWVGWLAVARVDRLADGTFDVAGRLVDMEEMDRGMLGLYLSTQPMAA